jgi:hypothetical protein
MSRRIPTTGLGFSDEVKDGGLRDRYWKRMVLAAVMGMADRIGLVWTPNLVIVKLR